MKRHFKVLLLVAGLATKVGAQQVPIPTKQAAPRPLIGERDKAEEDQVAKLLGTIRADTKIKQLSRIRHRDKLEQQICSIAQGSVPQKRAASDTSAFYQTSRPESISAELKTVASFDDDRFPRYSVAVWRLKDPQTRELTFWVGVERYRSAGFEFFDNHFTDDIFYHNDWKNYVAPVCRGK
jgi:hypothetical protein